ncbi:MAG: hypothetical protein PHQ40_20535 [Anaerolineaceae bacterium]|nr:hypothetical protein [Anaerolineaceae bacterium]
MSREECPILRRAAGQGMELKHSLRRLKKTLAICQACCRRDECETTERVQEWVEQAIQEALDELGC